MLETELCVAASGGLMKLEQAHLFACDAAARSELNNVAGREGTGKATPVTLTFRDLGSHLDATARATATAQHRSFRNVV
jgi:hypothetical protein